MQLQSSFPSQASSASVRVLIEHGEDLWHLYNLVSEGDRLTARTSRKVKQENSAGNVNVQVKRMVLQIELVKVDFQPNDKCIRFSGRCLTDHDDIRHGQFHTLEISLHDTLTIEKDSWDYAARARLHEATDLQSQADVGAILLQGTTAAVFLMTSTSIKECGRIHGSTSKATVRNVAHNKIDKQKKRFYDGVMLNMQTHLPLDTLRCVILAGPNDVRTEFFEYMLATATQKNIQPILGNQKIFVQCLANGTGSSQLAEVLEDETVAKRVAGTKASGELAAIRTFYKQQKENEHRVCYGPQHVEKAAEMAAIDYLMISDGLFRAQDIEQRKRFSSIAQAVEESGGKVLVVASEGLAGEQIKALAGIAATLRYPVHDEE